MKKILFDQSAFEVYKGRYIDSQNILHFLNLYYNNIYLIKREEEELKANVEHYVKGIINYKKDDLRRQPSQVFFDIISKTGNSILSDLLVISSDQELLYLFDDIPVETCLIYKNILDCVEINPTYEFRNLESVKKLILK